MDSQEIRVGFHNKHVGKNQSKDSLNVRKQHYIFITYVGLSFNFFSKDEVYLANWKKCQSEYWV